MSRTALRSIPVFLALVGLAACGATEPGGATPAATTVAPLLEGASAYEIAGTTPLEEQASEDRPDLHNVYRLGDDIVSGGEPHGEAALAHLASLGIKTIVSVDGKTPDVETAARLGMRYVHVPIQYSGIPTEARVRLAKTFRELDGPFYVHCFHGKHRGPAAAVWGRKARDGVPRERALAEMRQWCGTSGKYQGLFETVGRAPVPTEAVTEALEWDFPSAHRFEGVRHVMIGMARAWDHLAALEKRGWQMDPEHPDVSALNEATKLQDLFRAMADLEEIERRPDDFRAWLGESVAASRTLVTALTEAADLGAASPAFRAVKARCDSCHGGYRNN